MSSLHRTGFLLTPSAFHSAGRLSLGTALCQFSDLQLCTLLVLYPLALHSIDPLTFNSTLFQSSDLQLCSLSVLWPSALHVANSLPLDSLLSRSTSNTLYSTKNSLHFLSLFSSLWITFNKICLLQISWSKLSEWTQEHFIHFLLTLSIIPSIKAIMDFGRFEIQNLPLFLWVPSNIYAKCSKKFYHHILQI